MSGGRRSRDSPPSADRPTFDVTPLLPVRGVWNPKHRRRLCTEPTRSRSPGAAQGLLGKSRQQLQTHARRLSYLLSRLCSSVQCRYLGSAALLRHMTASQDGLDGASTAPWPPHKETPRLTAPCQTAPRHCWAEWVRKHQICHASHRHSPAPSHRGRSESSVVSHCQTTPDRSPVRVSHLPPFSPSPNLQSSARLPPRSRALTSAPEPTAPHGPGTGACAGPGRLTFSFSWEAALAAVTSPK